VNFHWRTVSGGPRLIIVLNFVKIGLSIVEILQFFKFSVWLPLLSLIWLTGSRGSRLMSMPNFNKIGQSLAKILRFFRFFKIASVRHPRFIWGIFGPPTVSTWGSLSLCKIWRLPPSWIVKFAKFYWLTVSGWPRWTTVPNFVKIGRSVVEILRFFKLSRWPLPPSWIFEIT